MRICLVTSRIPPARCGVGDYTANLAGALADAGHQVTIVTAVDQAASVADARVTVINAADGWAIAGAGRLARRLRAIKADLVVFQWVPFLYHRLGISLGVPLAALLLRLAGVRTATMVHEPWVPMTRLPWLVTGPIQRAALLVLCLASDSVFVSIQRWAEMLQRLLPWKRRMAWLPVGSNIPVVAVDERRRDALFAKLAIPPRARLVSLFSPGGSGKMLDLVTSLAERLLAAHPDVIFLLIGEVPTGLETARRALPHAPRCIATGYLEGEAVSILLHASAASVSPLVDGVSTRRGSIIAALAHGVPVITNLGFLSDDLFRDGAPVTLAALNADDYCAKTLAAIAAVEQGRSPKAEIAAYAAQHFGWDRIARTIAETVSTKAR